MEVLFLKGVYNDWYVFYVCVSPMCWPDVDSVVTTVLCWQLACCHTGMHGMHAPQHYAVCRLSFRTSCVSFRASCVRIDDKFQCYISIAHSVPIGGVLQPLFMNYELVPYIYYI